MRILLDGCVGLVVEVMLGIGRWFGTEPRMVKAELRSKGGTWERETRAGNITTI
jgi:hypothetical protein